jgi:oxygen-independent coproporphyrinogen III oxidase
VAGRRQFIGFGNAAISFLGSGYFQNKIDLNAYLQAVSDRELPMETGRGHLLSTEDEIRNALIAQHIMSDFSIAMTPFGNRFGIDFPSHFQAEINRLNDLARDGLVTFDTSGTLTVTATGRFFARHVAKVFDQYG